MRKSTLMGLTLAFMMLAGPSCCMAGEPLLGTSSVRAVGPYGVPRVTRSVTFTRPAIFAPRLAGSVQRGYYLQPTYTGAGYGSSGNAAVSVLRVQPTYSTVYSYGSSGG